MRKLLLAVDGSQGSQSALAHVVELARDMSLSVCVLNVRRPVSGDVSLFVSAAELERLHAEEGNRVVAPVLEALRGHGIECSGHVLVGQVGETIARYAAERGMDGIVIGTRGLGNVAGALLGSVAFKVVHLADQPVTLIK